MCVLRNLAQNTYAYPHASKLEHYNSAGSLFFTKLKLCLHCLHLKNLEAGDISVLTLYNGTFSVAIPKRARLYVKSLSLNSVLEFVGYSPDANVSKTVPRLCVHLHPSE